MKRSPVPAAVSLEIRCGNVPFFHASTFVWEVCTLVPCSLHVLGGSSFLSVQIRSSLTALHLFEIADKENLVLYGLISTSQQFQDRIYSPLNLFLTVFDTC